MHAVLRLCDRVGEKPTADDIETFLHRYTDKLLASHVFRSSVLNAHPYDAVNAQSGCVVMRTWIGVPYGEHVPVF